MRYLATHADDPDNVLVGLRASSQTHDSALQPEDWLDGAVDLFDAGAWFGSGTDSTIVQTLKPTYSLGAAFRPWVPFVVAVSLETV